MNDFENETTVIFKFLKEERKANRELLEVFNTTRLHGYENECIQKYSNSIGYDIPTIIDPVVSFFQLYSYRFMYHFIEFK